MEEKLDLILKKLEKLETGQEKIVEDITGLKTEVASLKVNVTALKTGQEEMGNTITMAYESLQYATEDRKKLLQG